MSTSDVAQGSTDPRLNPELKVKWLEALRSGDYPQDIGELRSKDGWCCLGVLAYVAGVDECRLRNQDTLSASNVKRDDLLGPWDKPEYSPINFSSSKPETLITTQRKLAAMNDEGKSFGDIADWIEANL